MDTNRNLVSVTARVRNSRVREKILKNCISGGGITRIYIYIDCSADSRATLHVKSIKEQKYAF